MRSAPASHRCEAVALTTANVCEVPFDQLADVAAQLPSLQQQLLRVIGQSVGRDQDHMDMLVRRQANERIALFLHGLGERFRHIGQSGTHIQAADEPRGHRAASSGSRWKRSAAASPGCRTTA